MPPPDLPQSFGPRFALREGLGPFLVLAGVSSALFAVLWLIDFGAVSPIAVWTLPEASETLANFAEVVAAVLALTITVVAIIVELAANRYTPRISELFIRDPVNVAVMGYFVVTSVLVVWIDMSLHGANHPEAMALAAVALMSVGLLVILPYFSYVFHFLSPSEVIRRIQVGGAVELAALAKGAATVPHARQAAVVAIEQLGDIAMASVDKKDKPLTLSAVEALANAAHGAIRLKPSLPPAFFDTAPLARSDQDFIALHIDMVRVLTERRTWVEMKVFRQYQSVFGESLNKMRDVNHLIAIHTRRVAITAWDAKDADAFRLAVRFLNTYMRATLNARDVRTAYNLLNEYRLLAEDLLARGDDDAIIEVAGYIQYYGQVAFGMQLAFLLETAAYDLCSLLERAIEAKAACQEALLAMFLELDREPEGDGKTQEASLRGVRKAQIKLATYYLAAADVERARRIFDDMHAEKPERLRSIRAELERVTDAEYWEVSDRGINFEWLPPAQREMLPVFFAWFPH